MKTVALLLCTVAAAAALTVTAPIAATLGGAPGAAAEAPDATAGAPGAAGGAAASPGFIDYENKVYRVGAKNPLALEPNPFVIQRAVAVVERVPYLLVRLDLNGEVTLTNQFGQEEEVVDAFGREIEVE